MVVFVRVSGPDMFVRFPKVGNTTIWGQNVASDINTMPRMVFDDPKCNIITSCTKIFKCFI